MSSSRRRLHAGSWWIPLVLLLFAFGPLLMTMAAGGIAAAAGCRLDEGSVHRCEVLGADWGGALYTLFVLGWLSLATLPIGLGALCLWGIVKLFRRRR